MTGNPLQIVPQPIGEVETIISLEMLITVSLLALMLRNFLSRIYRKTYILINWKICQFTVAK